MTVETGQDVAAALSRLEAAAPGGMAAGVDVGPVVPLEAVRVWAAAEGMRPGAYLAPPVTQLAAFYSAFARAHGWAMDEMDARTLGKCLRRLGFRGRTQGGTRSVFVGRPVARRMWASTPPDMRPGRTPKRKAARAGRVDAPLFWRVYAGRRKSSAQPLVDSLGRVWPSARVAASLLPRACRAPIQLAAKRGSSASGVLWRYLLPDEVALIPADARCGQRMEWLAWGGPTRCPACGHGLRPGLPPPPPGGFPTPSPLESRAGGPTHTRCSVSPPQESCCTDTVPK